MREPLSHPSGSRFLLPSILTGFSEVAAKRPSQGSPLTQTHGTQKRPSIRFRGTPPSLGNPSISTKEPPALISSGVPPDLPLARSRRSAAPRGSALPLSGALPPPRGASGPRRAAHRPLRPPPVLPAAACSSSQLRPAGSLSRSPADRGSAEALVPLQRPLRVPDLRPELELPRPAGPSTPAHPSPWWLPSCVAVARRPAPSSPPTRFPGPVCAGVRARAVAAADARSVDHATWCGFFSAFTV